MPGFIPDRSKPVIVQNRDVLEAIAGASRATGSVVLGDLPVDGDVLALAGVTFEFLDDVADVGEGNVAVQIGSDVEETRDSLLTAMGDSLPRFLLEAVSTDEVDLEYYDVGSQGNFAITTDCGDIDVVGMLGGTDGGVLTALDGSPTVVDVVPLSTTLDSILVSAGSAVNAALRRLMLVPIGAEPIYWADGTASVTSAPVPAAGITLDCRANFVGRREFYAAQATKMLVVQEG